MSDRESLKDRAKRYFGGAFSEMAVLYGNRRATVRGCGKILFYSTEEIRLALRGRELSLRGDDLRCVSFAGGSVTVVGTLRAVEFRESGGTRP